MEERELREEKKNESQDKNMSPWVTKILTLENPGIDPGTFRMRSGRSTIWANSPEYMHFSWETYD